MDRQSDRYDQLGDIVGSVLWDMDLATWTITSINQGSLDLTGTQSVRYLGRAEAWTDQIVDADRERFKQKAMALQPGEKTVIDYRMQRMDGQEVWVRSNLCRSRDRQDHRIFGANTDISASKRYASRAWPASPVASPTSSTTPSWPCWATSSCTP